MTDQNNAAQAWQDTVHDAILILTEEADALSDCHTRAKDDWAQEPEAKARYDHILAVAEALSKLRAPVADEHDEPTAPDDDAIAECWVSVSDIDGIAYDGPSFERGYRAALASAPVAGENAAQMAGLESSINILSALVDHQRLLLVEVEDVCGRDGHGGPLEDGESDLIDRVRQHLSATSPAAQPASERPVAGESRPMDWQNAQRIAELPEVDEALANFCDDSTLDNAVGLVLAVLGAAPQASEAVRDAGITASAQQLVAAAKAMTKLYPHVWDRADGALVVFPENVAKFDAAFDALRVALGEAVEDDGIAALSAQPEQS